MRINLEEREITLALLNFLSQANWQILSVNFPGAQGGLSISTYGKTRGWVPDLVALKRGILLTVESKPSYFPKDVKKLSALYNDEKVIAKLRSKLDLGIEILCQKSIVYHYSSLNKIKVPSSFVVFVVDDKMKLSFFFGEPIPDQVKLVIKS